MNPKYFHEFLGVSMGPPIDERSSGGGLAKLCDLLKWKTSILEYFIMCCSNHLPEQHS